MLNLKKYVETTCKKALQSILLCLLALVTNGPSRPNADTNRDHVKRGFLWALHFYVLEDLDYKPGPVSWCRNYYWNGSWILFNWACTFFMWLQLKPNCCIAQFLQYEFSIGLEIPLEVFFQPNRKVVSNDIIVNYIENMWCFYNWLFKKSICCYF